MQYASRAKIPVFISIKGAVIVNDKKYRPRKMKKPRTRAPY